MCVCLCLCVCVYGCVGVWVCICVYHQANPARTPASCWPDHQLHQQCWAHCSCWVHRHQHSKSIWKMFVCVRTPVCQPLCSMQNYFSQLAWIMPCFIGVVIVLKFVFESIRNDLAFFCFLVLNQCQCVCIYVVFRYTSAHYREEDLAADFCNC